MLTVSPINFKLCDNHDKISNIQTRKFSYNFSVNNNDIFINNSANGIVNNQNKEIITFGRKIDADEKRKCHYIIHGASAVCGAISAAMGEGAAVGADTPFLWGAQGAMFFLLQNTLGIDTIDHAMYIARQFMQGQALGVGGARILISWLGLGAEVASAGTATPVSTALVRGVNSVLSTGITEKMGWGYVRSVEHDSMTLAQQSLRTGLYYLGNELFGHSDEIYDPNNISDIKTVMQNIPKENLSMYGKIMKVMIEDFHTNRFAFIFGSNFLQNILFSKDHKITKDKIKRALNISLLNTAVYDLLDYQYNQTVTKEMTETVNKLAEELKNTPEVFKEFQKIQEEFIQKFNIDDLDSKAFLDQFKNKEFTHNFAVFSSEMSSLLAEKWRKRNFNKLRARNDKAMKELQTTMNRGNEINSQMSDDAKKSIKEIVAKSKASLSNKARSNFALGKIAGYDGIKTLLSIALINPIKQKSDNIPNAIMFYGPSGMGKTALGTAIAEDTGCKFRALNIGFMDDEKMFNWLDKQVKEAMSLKQNKRHTIIQLNEVDGMFEDNPEILDKFIEILQNASKKYGCTFLLTTNNPLSTNEKIRNNMDLFVALTLQTKEDIKAIINHYLKGKEIKNFDIDEIVNEFYQNNNTAYSNAQIENIITEQIPSPCSQQDFIDIIRKTKPCITKDIVKNFEKDMDMLTGDSK